jgi:hypothetical protein
LKIATKFSLEILICDRYVKSNILPERELELDAASLLLIKLIKNVVRPPDEVIHIEEMLCFGTTTYSVPTKE